MGDEARQWWEAHAREFQTMAQLPIDIEYGPQANEEKLRLLGDVAGKAVLEIGCGGAQCGIAFAKRGATVTGVDIAGAQLAFARELAAQHGVVITFHQHDMTDLSPIASASQDIVFSASALNYVDDIVACFREVHRVLRLEGVFVFSVGHPCMIVDGFSLRPPRSYFETGKVVLGTDVSDEAGFAFADNRRTVSQYVNAVVEAGLVVEQMVEPDIRPVDRDDPRNRQWDLTPELLTIFPATLVLKSRKA